MTTKEIILMLIGQYNRRSEITALIVAMSEKEGREFDVKFEIGCICELGNIIADIVKQSKNIILIKESKEHEFDFGDYKRTLVYETLSVVFK